MHAKLLVLDTGRGADLELQSASETARTLAKSFRAHFCPLEHATIQRPGAARFLRRGEGGKIANCRRATSGSPPLRLCRSRILRAAPRALLSIFFTRTNDDYQV